MLEIQELSKSYGRDTGGRWGQLFCAGRTGGSPARPNGAGKSTIIKSIARLLRYKGKNRHSGNFFKRSASEEDICLCAGDSGNV